MYHKNIRYLPFESSMLRSYPNLSRSKRTVGVLLPDNYHEQKRFPTVWFLGGFGSNGLDMLNDPGPFRLAFAEKLLAYQRQGLIAPFISVFPDGTTDLGGSQYINSSANGPFMDHLCDELVPLVDKELRTVAEPIGRVITGHSSGGYGALMTCMLRPGIFGSMIASAADSAFDISQKPSWLTAAIEIKRCGGVNPFLEHFEAQVRKEKVGQALFIANMQLAMSSCFSPLPNANKAHCALPVDLDSMEFKDDIWQSWLNLDPCEAVKQHWDKLAQLSYLHLDCGSEDEYGAQFGHRKIKKTLEQHNVSFNYTEFSGTHRKTSYRYEERLRMLGEAMQNQNMWLDS